ncbi:MAG: hypothetical protein LAO51_07125 [Acidobacteriia bacterium]|nr:hypothetical protein [Terriglobia bacterium]
MPLRRGLRAVSSGAAAPDPALLLVLLRAAARLDVDSVLRLVEHAARLRLGLERPRPRRTRRRDANDAPIVTADRRLASAA